MIKGFKVNGCVDDNQLKVLFKIMIIDKGTKFSAYGIITNRR